MKWSNRTKYTNWWLDTTENDNITQDELNMNIHFQMKIQTKSELKQIKEGSKYMYLTWVPGICKTNKIAES